MWPRVTWQVIECQGDRFIAYTCLVTTCIPKTNNIECQQWLKNKKTLRSIMKAVNVFFNITMVNTRRWQQSFFFSRMVIAGKQDGDCQRKGPVCMWMKGDFIIYFLKDMHDTIFTCLFTVFRLDSRCGLGCCASSSRASRVTSPFFTPFFSPWRPTCCAQPGSQWPYFPPDSLHWTAFAAFAGNLLHSFNLRYLTPIVLSPFLNLQISLRRNLHSHPSSHLIGSHHSPAWCEMMSALLIAHIPLTYCMATFTDLPLSKGRAFLSIHVVPSI